MVFKRLLTGAFIGLVSFGAWAEPNWKIINYTEDEIFSMDMNSISPISNYQATHKVWMKQTIYKDLKTDGLTVGDYRMLLQWVHCGNRTMGFKSITIYKKLKNGLVDNESFSTPSVEMNDVIPGSIGENVVDMVCSGFKSSHFEKINLFMK